MASSLTSASYFFKLEVRWVAPPSLDGVSLAYSVGSPHKSKEGATAPGGRHWIRGRAGGERTAAPRRIRGEAGGGSGDTGRRGRWRE